MGWVRVRRGNFSVLEGRARCPQCGQAMRCYSASRVPVRYHKCTCGTRCKSVEAEVPGVVLDGAPVTRG